MEKKQSLLFRLLGIAQGNAEKPEDEEGGQNLLPDQPETEPCPAKPLRHKLEPPQGSMFRKLWSIYCEQAGWQPMPELVLEGASDPVLPDAVGKAELLRLQMLVNTSAHKRFEQIQKQQNTAEGEQPALPDLDAQVIVFLAKDRMTAWVLVYPPTGGGRAVDREALDQALEAEQVCFGVDGAALDALPQDPERYFKLFPAAKGIAAVPGTNGRIEDLFPRVQKRKLIVDEHNQVDYKNLDFIHSVEKGGTICHIVPPVEGKPGRTVQDQEAPAKDGKAEAVPKGRNTELSEDGKTLVATISGHVEFSNRCFQVKPVLEIPGNVDFSVGNINFYGDVCIHGDVCSGFSVRATGSITVNGVVEACTLEAGRDLVVARGIQGDGQAVIRTQRSIFAKYLESCSAYAKISIEAECIINCDVYCDGGVTVRSGYGKLIGGKLQVAHEVYAGTIGSWVGNHTEIILGGDPCEEFDYQLLNRELLDLEDALERTDRQPDSPDKESRMAKMRMQMAICRSKLRTIDTERELQAQEAQEQQESQKPDVRRMRCDSVYPGTVLTIDGVTHHFTQQLSPCCAELRDDGIHAIQSAAF